MIKNYINNTSYKEPFKELLNTLGFIEELEAGTRVRIPMLPFHQLCDLSQFIFYTNEICPFLSEMIIVNIIAACKY